MDKLARQALGYYFFGIGLLLLLAPWTPLWSRNYFIHSSGPLAGVLLSRWARGALSGVGALYIATGVRDSLSLAVGGKGD